MMTTRTVLLASALLLATACNQGDETNAADVDLAADIETLPADESAATPSESLENGAAPVPANEVTAAPASAIPPALHGRWALVPADCEAGRSDAKGLLTISADGLRFYESSARPQQLREQSDSRIVGDFAYTGEGMNWQRRVTLERSGNRLRRAEPAADGQPAVDLTYSACPA